MKLSPVSFCFGQFATLVMPWIFCGLLLATGAAAIYWHSASWATAIGALVLGSPIAYGYMAWGISNDWHGLVRTPKQKWVIAIDGETLSIRTKRHHTLLPIKIIKQVKLVQEWGWDSLKGVEDACLVVYFGLCMRISLPGSSGGFREVLEYFRPQTTFTTQRLGE